MKRRMDYTGNPYIDDSIDLVNARIDRENREEEEWDNYLREQRRLAEEKAQREAEAREAARKEREQQQRIAQAMSIERDKIQEINDYVGKNLQKLMTDYETMRQKLLAEVKSLKKQNQQIVEIQNNLLWTERSLEEFSKEQESVNPSETIAVQPNA